QTLEGSARHTGTHACGVIIGPDDLINHIPLSTAKDSDLMVTQYEGKLIESAGMLKMDFLGLKTLSIITSAIENISKRHGKRIEIEKVPLDDKKTFALYQKGDTIGTFQFESEGMRNYLQELKPTDLEDLIAMNALYRPGPMKFIPVYINRKYRKEKTEYPHKLLENILKPTYGIMVYQEQIMQTAQIMGGFTLGKADLLRRAMGKKNMEIMAEQKAIFVEGAKEKGVDSKKAEEVFDVMKEFAKYGFNRSHSAAYSVIAYYTGYLKAHYPAEYMAAVLTHNLNDIKKITFFIEECKRRDIPVNGPNINESELNFSVNSKGEILFGLAAVKNVGESAVKNIVEERGNNGNFKSIFDFANRVNLRMVNKRSFEALAMSGAFDSFENTHRAQYFFRENSDDSIFLEKVIKHASSVQARKNSSQVNLFGDLGEIEIKDPEIPECSPWTKMEQLKNEKEVTGFYMSGHPLEDFAQEIDSFCNINLHDLKENLKENLNKPLVFAGLLTVINHKTSKTGSPFGSFSIEDFNDSHQLVLFNEDYLKFKHLLIEGTSLMFRAKVAKRKRMHSETYEVRIHQVILLSDTMNKLAKKISVRILLEKITDEMIKSLAQSAEQNTGSVQLRIEVEDQSKGIILGFPSQIRIEPVGFLNNVKNLNNLNVKVIS
ncbi:MAG: DNA polymerase III subunit alpha, partial [Desulfobacula sp.]|nr:DNA polymerase III subunit alpha [Desulfobacula sp.]